MTITDLQKSLSKVNTDFFKFIENNPEAMESSNYSMLDLNNKLFVLQPWPTFINQETRTEFEEASVKVFDLIKSLPKRLFDYDIKKISSFYEIPEDLTKLHIDGITETGIQNLLGRGDFFITSSGLKCLEYNITSNLGGLYEPIWENLYINTPIISKFLNEYNVKINNENLIQLILEHILHSIPNEMMDASREKNIVLITRGFTNPNNIDSYLNNLMKISIENQNEDIRGNIYICDYHQLNIVDNFVYHKGKKIHAMVEMYVGIITPEVLEVYKSGNLMIFNGPVTELMSNKLNLVLLSDYEKANDLFSDDEKRIIDKYIPWSRKIMPGFTTYQQERVNLEELITLNKDRFVLKAGIGYGGSEVIIGQKKTWEQWHQLVKIALEQKNWMVQEFVDHLPGLYQSGERGAELHDIVWGFFVMGSQYGGAWARVIPQIKNKGTINCHQGAKVSVIFDVDE